MLRTSCFPETPLSTPRKVKSSFRRRRKPEITVSLLKAMTMKSGQATPRVRRLLLLLLVNLTVVAERQETAAMLRRHLRVKKGDHRIHRSPDFA
jgi:hypothetical protein